MDDKTPELHDKAVRNTLQRLKSNGLTLNRAKCLFDQPKIKLFGFVLSASRVSPHSAKVQALKEAERPTNAEDRKCDSFLEMANYSARSIKNFYTLSAPLRENTRKAVNFRWTVMNSGRWKSSRVLWLRMQHWLITKWSRNRSCGCGGC